MGWSVKEKSEIKVNNCSILGQIWHRIRVDRESGISKMPLSVCIQVEK